MPSPYFSKLWRIRETFDSNAGAWSCKCPKSGEQSVCDREVLAKWFVMQNNPSKIVTPERKQEITEHGMLLLSRKVLFLHVVYQCITKLTFRRIGKCLALLTATFCSSCSCISSKSSFLFAKFLAGFFKENVRYPVWICRDPISLILGTRIGSLKRLKKNLFLVRISFHAL